MTTTVLCLLASWSRGRGRAGASAAELPSAILAAALLLPAGGGESVGFGFSGSNLLSGPLIAILTVDGMIHVQLPSCIVVVHCRCSHLNQGWHAPKQLLYPLATPAHSIVDWRHRRRRRLVLRGQEDHCKDLPR